MNPKDLVGRNKIPYSCIPATVIAELALAMLEGARIYGRHNYRVIDVESSTYIDACKRHIDAYVEGEDIDPDSGQHHIVKAIASLTVLRDAQIQGRIVDDRPPKSPKGWMQSLNKQVKEIIEKYPNCKPAYLEGDQNGS